MSLENNDQTQILNGSVRIREHGYGYSLNYSRTNGGVGACRVHSLRIKPVFRQEDGTESGTTFVDLYREVTSLLGKIEADLHVELERRKRRESMDMNPEIFQRFAPFDDRLEMLKSMHEKGIFSRREEPTASMRATTAEEAKSDDRELRDVTMVTVADLYRRALLNFPKRDRGVVEYIQEHLPWLNKNEVTYLIQRARKRGIDLPIYRRGRVPVAKRRVTSKDF